MWVYKIQNTIDGKLYIGKTQRTLRTRWLEHISDSRRPCTTYLHAAIKKHGPENFTIEPIANLQRFPSEMLDVAECSFIEVLETYNPAKGYNLTLGGDGAQWTDEARHKASLTHKSRMTNKRRETCKLLGKSRAGCPRPDLAARNRQNKPTHCKHGHLFDEANTYHSKTRPNKRQCKTCIVSRTQEYRKRLSK